MKAQDNISFMVRIEREQAEKLDYLCKRYGKSRNEYLNEMIRQELEKFAREEERDEE